MNKKTITIILTTLVLALIAGSFWYVKNSSEQEMKNNVIANELEKPQTVQNTNTQDDIIASDDKIISKSEQ